MKEHHNFIAFYVLNLIFTTLTLFVMIRATNGMSVSYRFRNLIGQQPMELEFFGLLNAVAILAVSVLGVVTMLLKTNKFKDWYNLGMHGVTGIQLVFLFVVLGLKLKTYNYLKNNMEYSFSVFYVDKDIRILVDKFQKQFSCCGGSSVNNFFEDDSTQKIRLPKSCCEQTFENCTIDSSSRFRTVCVDAAFRSVITTYHQVFTTLGVLIFFQFLAAYFLNLTRTGV